MLTYFVANMVILRMQSRQMGFKAVNFSERKRAFSKAADDLEDIERPASFGYGYLRQGPHLLVLRPHLRRIGSNAAINKIEFAFGSN